MQNTRKLGGAAVAGLLSLGLLATAPESNLQAGPPEWEGFEKCAGIAREGKNDCGANGHACAGFATRDNDPNEWVYVPRGVCEKITGGRIIATDEG